MSSAFRKREYDLLAAAPDWSRARSLNWCNTWACP